MLKEDDKKFEANFDIKTEVEFETENASEVRHDVQSYRRVAEGIPIAAWFILVNEFW
jgi:hypothetical protein